MTPCPVCGLPLIRDLCPDCEPARFVDAMLSLDVSPGQFISPAHYGAWMRGKPMRALRTRWKVPARYRAIVLAHAGYKCAECGGREDIQIEHVVPVVFGGSNEPANMIALCGPHNRERWSPEFRALLRDAEAA